MLPELTIHHQHCLDLVLLIELGSSTLEPEDTTTTPRYDLALQHYIALGVVLIDDVFTVCLLTLDATVLVISCLMIPT